MKLTEQFAHQKITMSEFIEKVNKMEADYQAKCLQLERLLKTDHILHCRCVELGMDPLGVDDLSINPIV